MTSYNIVAATNDVTVVAEYSPEYRVEGQKWVTGRGCCGGC